MKQPPQSRFYHMTVKLTEEQADFVRELREKVPGASVTAVVMSAVRLGLPILQEDPSRVVIAKRGRPVDPIVQEMLRSADEEFSMLDELLLQ